MHLGMQVAMLSFDVCVPQLEYFLRSGESLLILLFKSFASTEPEIKKLLNGLLFQPSFFFNTFKLMLMNLLPEIKRRELNVKLYITKKSIQNLEKEKVCSKFK